MRIYEKLRIDAIDIRIIQLIQIQAEKTILHYKLARKYSCVFFLAKVNNVSNFLRLGNKCSKQFA